MDVVGSEIGQKMRSAIKAKLTELGCYVDDELPDYVMVMVANKRTRSQMEDDLQLFLGDNTELFVNWLHQVLKKLQEVTVTTPLKIDGEKLKEKSITKEKKLKDKKDKSKKGDASKKSKKKAKEKSHKKKEDKKKSKKKIKHDMIRPNIPPLFMNIEKESEPSITDVFAGQILKNHGIIMDAHKDELKLNEQKPTETKRLIIPIIDPATIPSQTTSCDVDSSSTTQTTNNESVAPSNTQETLIISNTDDSNSTSKPDEKVLTSKTGHSIIEIADDESRAEKMKEMTEIEAKIQGLKQKLADQLESRNDSVSDDDDFLNIRTEADELINDFAEDVFQEISQPPPVVTPPLRTRKSRSPSPPPSVSNTKKVVPKDIPETLPQIELNLPKRPIRERLGAPIQKIDAVIEQNKAGKTTERAEKTPERLTPEKEPDIRHQKSAKSRLGNQPERSEQQRKRTISDDSAKSENSSKRLTSRVSVLENRPSRLTCASVVRVRPRPRVGAPASSLLMRAVADAHKSLLNIPPKVDPEPQQVKRALVLPMRRTVDPKKIVIQVPCSEISTNNSTDSISDNVNLGDLNSESDEKNTIMSTDITGKEEYTPIGITKVIQNEYVPSRTLIRRDDTLFVETINIHNTTVDKDKNTQFIVTMDGYHPNAFLAKKLMTEGLLNDDEDIIKPSVDHKTETNKKGPKGILGNNNNKGTKDIAKVAEDKTLPSVTSSRVQPLSDIRDKSIVSKEEIKEPLLDMSDSSIKDLGIEKRKRDVSVTNFEENRKSDNDPENPNVAKRKRETSVEKELPEKTKTDSVIDPIYEKRKSNVSLVKPIQGKSKDYDSVHTPTLEKRKSDISLESSTSESDEKKTPVKKRKASPIIFDVDKKEKIVERVRERAISTGSDSYVVLSTASNTHKYDTVPSLSQTSKPVWCRTFPQCRYGSSCAFAHPRCKFAAACTRRGCVYSHAPNAVSPPALNAAPVVASHVVPAANYKSISAGAFANLCKFYPTCSNPACHYYHPKPCRYGKACTNKLECNFYHHDVPGGKWNYSV